MLLLPKVSYHLSPAEKLDEHIEIFSWLLLMMKDCCRQLLLLLISPDWSQPDWSSRPPHQHCLLRYHWRRLFVFSQGWEVRWGRGCQQSCLHQLLDQHLWTRRSCCGDCEKVRCLVLVVSRWYQSEESPDLSAEHDSTLVWTTDTIRDSGPGWYDEWSWRKRRSCLEAWFHSLPRSSCDEQRWGSRSLGQKESASKTRVYCHSPRVYKAWLQEDSSLCRLWIERRSGWVFEWQNWKFKLTLLNIWIKLSEGWNWITGEEEESVLSMYFWCQDKRYFLSWTGSSLLVDSLSSYYWVSGAEFHFYKSFLPAGAWASTRMLIYDGKNVISKLIWIKYVFIWQLWAACLAVDSL